MENSPNTPRLQLSDLTLIASSISKLPPLPRLFFIMQVFHGTKSVETRTAKWSHFDLDNARWHVKTGGDNSSARTISLCAGVVGLLERAKTASSSPYLFSKGDKESPVKEIQVSFWMRDLIKEVGTAFSLYDLRALANAILESNPPVDIPESLLSNE